MGEKNDGYGGDNIHDDDACQIEMEELNPKTKKNVVANNNQKKSNSSSTGSDKMVIVKNGVNQILLLLQLYRELYPNVFRAISGLFALFLVWVLLLHPLIRRKKVLKRNRLAHDYSALELHYNFKKANIDHYCLFGGDDKCDCEDPTESVSREDQPGWVRTHESNKKKIQWVLEMNRDVDVLFLGDDLVESLNGLSMGKKSSQSKLISKYYNNTFNNVLTHIMDTDDMSEEFFNALALGVTGDRTTNLFWRLQHGEMNLIKDLNPKVFWLMIGTNDLVTMGCSEEVATLGILRVAEEIAFHNPSSIIVIQAIMPRSYDPNGHLVSTFSPNKNLGKEGSRAKTVPDIYGNRNLYGTTTTTTTTTTSNKEEVKPAPFTQTSPYGSGGSSGGGGSTGSTGSTGTRVGGGSTGSSGTRVGGGGSTGSSATPVGGSYTGSSATPVGGSYTGSSGTRVSGGSTGQVSSGTRGGSTGSSGTRVGGGSTGSSGARVSGGSTGSIGARVSGGSTGMTSSTAGGGSTVNVGSGSTGSTGSGTRVGGGPTTSGGKTLEQLKKEKQQRMDELIAKRKETLAKYNQNKPLAVGRAKPGTNSTISATTIRKYDKELYKSKSPLKRPDYMREFWPSIQQINYELEQFCKKHDHFIYYDPSALFIGSVGNAHYKQSQQQIITELMPDYVHMSTTGFKLYAGQVVKELQRIIYDDDETNDVVVKSSSVGEFP